MVECINEKINRGHTAGTLEWVFFREDYDDITEEMEEIFDGEDTTSVCAEWELKIL